MMGAVNATTSHKHCYHLECFKATGPPWLEGVVDVEAEVEGYQLAGELWPAIRARLTNQPQGCLFPNTGLKRVLLGTKETKLTHLRRHFRSSIFA